MQNGGSGIERWRVSGVILSVILLVCGCGQSGASYGADKEYGREPEKVSQEDSAEISEKTNEAAKEQTKEDIEEKTREDIKTEVENKIKILSVLKSDKNFRYGVQDSVRIKDTDTADMILQKLGQCETLTLTDFWEPIYSLEHLSLVPNLKSLSLSIRRENGSEIEDFTPVAELSNLEEFSLMCDLDETIDLSFLAEKKRITELSLSNCQMKDIAFLESMPQLESLSLCGTSVEDFGILEKLPNLVKLEIVDSADAVNIETVGKLSKLRDLTLENCDIADMEFLSGLTEIRSINLNGNSIEDLSPLAAMTKLERLEASENEIKDISPLKDLSDLFELVLNGNEISDISALSGLSRLNQVELSDNQILDLTPLEGKEELMYLSVSDNPYKDLKPVWHVPVLYYACQEVTDREAEFVKSWMEERYSTVLEYECIDYIEGDLNKDGRTDIAFVVDGTFEDGDGDWMYDEFGSSRLLFVLLNQRDGAWREAAALSLMGKYDGGTRGDPYRGSFMGDGYLITKEGWGSGSGGTITEIYLYQGEKLEQVREIWVEDYNYTDNYYVSVTDVENDTQFKYIIASDRGRLVKVDLADSEYPFHKAFAIISVDMDICGEKPKLNTSPARALDDFCDKMAADAEKANLPYAPWQKESYELLTGIELPDHYYTVPGTEESGENSGKATEEISEEVWEGDYIYYRSLCGEDGEFRHEICYVTKDGRTYYTVDDNTGEIRGG